MAKIGITVTIDNTNEFAKAIVALSGQKVFAGIPAEKGPRSGDEPINNAAIMYINENGDPERNLPARPVVVPAVAGIRKALIKEQEAALKNVLALRGGNQVAVIEALFNRLGIMAQNALRARITSGPFAPLAPRTIVMRLAKGFTGTKPLIVTGQLRRALTYVIRKVKAVRK